MSIETLLERLTEATERNSDLLERVVAGQTAALEKIGGTPSAAKKTADAAKKTADEAADLTEDAKPAAKKPAAKKAPAKKKDDAITDDALRSIVAGWVNGASDQAETDERKDFLKSMLNHFGITRLLGEGGLEADDQERRAQAVFYVNRMKAGLDTDFSHDYDFAGSPDQDVADADDDDIFG